MRLALHTIVCCCIIAAVLPVPVQDAAGDASLKKRIRTWLQNRTKTDLDAADGAQQVDGESTSPPPSSGLNSRPRRAAGCALFMCAYHDLLQRLNHIYNKQKEVTAPKNKILSTGYGRRRRRSPEDGALETDVRDSEEAPPLCRYRVCTAA
ncbi:adrenomedullin-4 precursor [Takifugu rubripes]|uniref:Adrenomedullin-4 n=1 Tax=Takifugu rubripes TaxID=31033 RepID=Q75XW5_TAKRU|nr:adrenomedullin-4 precursor [Takifugu rubripes]BAD02344.1 adrenomedullin-4 [Takifugu rubripes]|eukprot:NP_001027757.1 adrenomedullin-4 precursor [Takifugu rubripes]